EVEHLTLASRTNARLGRSLFLFLFGVSPTLPALIHIEVASVLHHADSMKMKKSAEAILESWQRRIRRHLLFVQRYRRALEVTKIRLDLMLLWLQRYEAKKLDDNALFSGKPKADKFGVRVTLTPDMSYSSVGIKGVRLFKKNVKDGDKKK